MLLKKVAKNIWPDPDLWWNTSTAVRGASMIDRIRSIITTLLQQKKLPTSSFPHPLVFSKKLKETRKNEGLF